MSNCVYGGDLSGNGMGGAQLMGTSNAGQETYFSGNGNENENGNRQPVLRGSSSSSRSLGAFFI